MRILQVISSSSTSGAERHTLDLSRSLVQAGHEVDLVCSSEGWVTRQARNSGIPVEVVPMKGTHWLTAVQRIRSIVKQGRHDLIHAHLTRAAYVAYAAARWAGKPVVTTVHIANNDQIYSRIAKSGHRLIAVSGYVAGMLHGRGVDDRLIDIVYNGTGFLDFEPADAWEVKQELGFDADDQLIGIVGRIGPAKGHLHLLRAFEEISHRHPKARLLMVGGMLPSFEEPLLAEITACGLQDKVTFTGLREDVPRLLDSCAFTTLPSELETFGLAAVESMARGRAVVAAPVGALPEVVRHGQTGLLVDPASDAYAAALDHLLTDDRIRTEMGACGRLAVQEKFSVPAMTKFVLDVYGKALAG